MCLPRNTLNAEKAKWQGWHFHTSFVAENILHKLKIPLIASCEHTLSGFFFSDGHFYLHWTQPREEYNYMIRLNTLRYFVFDLNFQNAMAKQCKSESTE